MAASARGGAQAQSHSSQRRKGDGSAQPPAAIGQEVAGDMPNRQKVGAYGRMAYGGVWVFHGRIAASAGRHV